MREKIRKKVSIQYHELVTFRAIRNKYSQSTPKELERRVLQVAEDTDHYNYKVNNYSKHKTLGLCRQESRR